MLLSDNGAAAEAGLSGFFRRAYSGTATFEEMRDHLDERGGSTTQPLYQRPWAMSNVTPFTRYKAWPYAGGSRTPLIVSWSALTPDPGAIRTDYVDVIGLAPTLAEAAHGHIAEAIDGQAQINATGRSILAGISNPAIPVGRPVQFFELNGNRAIREGSWKAVAIHKRGTSFEDDEWHLFDLSADFAEAHDLAASRPEVLARLKATWAREARANGIQALTERSWASGGQSRPSRR